MATDFNDGKTSTFGRELMNYISSKLPYSGFNVASLTDNLNPKYRYFEDTGTKRAEVLSRHSISQNFEYNNSSVGNITVDKRYNEVMYANIQKDKLARIRDYRIMAAFSEVANALDEICDEIINIDSSTNSCLNIKFKNIILSDFQTETIQKEFFKYINHFDFEHKGWSYFRQLLVEGEIYWEHIIHKDYPKEGILGVVQIPTELIDPVFSNVQNVMVKGYLFRKPKFDPNNPLKQVGIDYIPMDKNQITYIHSDVWNENKTMRLPFLENCRRAYRQLSMIEDAIVIYRLARAPERLVFNVDVGNMPAPKAEAYLKKLVTQYWSSKTYDPNQGGVVQKFNPQSILDNFWFAKRAGSEGTSVTQLAGACLAMDTKIPLLDGRILNIREIEQEIKENKKIWVYSTDPKTGHIAPGEVTWAGVTQEEAEVYKLTFDNGKELVCTPDHKFPILGKGFVEAKDLEIGESMIPFYTKRQKINKNSNEYEMIYQNDTKTWEYTHRTVFNFFKNYVNNMKNISESQSLIFDDKILKFVIDQVRGKSTHEVTREDLCNIINNTPEILNHFLKLNEGRKIKNWCGTKISYIHFTPMVKSFGYQTWKQFRKECELFNHRLVSIEKLPNKIQVGTLTIDNEEKYHNYHTFALDCGVFTKNSNLGELQDLMYFVKKLYQSLKVPTTRLDPQDAFRDGADMLREELKFARFIIRQQQLFALGIKNGFITHLQMKGLWKEFELKEETIQIEFNVPTNFYELRESQKLELKVSNFGNLASNESISPSFAQKRYLGWSDIDIKANREFLRKDKELRWELTQIENLGPKWKEALAAQAEAGGAAGGEAAGAGMPPAGGGAGPGGLPPAFTGGPAPTPEGGEAAPEAPAAEGGAGGPPEEAPA
jgi:hypothetical protein